MAQPPEFQRSDTARVEAFSDAVMAIAITILALALRSPQHAPGQLLTALLQQWPIYLGYLTSFAFIGVIWLNHHQAFTRILTVDRGLHAANLALLCTTAALVFPTDVLAAALQENLASTDARTAVALYALVATLMCASWLAIYLHLGRHPRLRPARVEPYIRHGTLRSAIGIAGYLLGGLLGWLVQPSIALVAFLLLPSFFFATSEGFPRLPRRSAPPNPDRPSPP